MHKRPLVPIFACFSAGILAGRYFPFSSSFLPGIAVLLQLFLLFLPCLKSVKFYVLLSLFLGSGVFFVSDTADSADLVRLSSGEKVILEGTVLTLPRTGNKIKRFELKAEKLFTGDKAYVSGQKILVTVFDNSSDFPIGIRIRFPAYLRPFTNFNNPGAYDYELSMRLNKISCNASVSDGRYIVATGFGNPGFTAGLTEKIRSPARAFLKKSLSAEDYALYRALLLGEKQGLNDEIREPFDMTGMSHVLAVSGLHIGIVAWLSFFISRYLLAFSEKLVLRHDIKRLAALIACIPVIAYTALTGFQVSGQRAMIMALTYLVSIILGREKDIWSTLLLSAVIILAIDPYSLNSISFQLTFLAVTGILWLTPVIQKLFPEPSAAIEKKRFLLKGYRYFTGLFSASLAANIFLLPVTVHYFYRISSAAVPANLVIVPLLGLIVLPAGMLSLILSGISPFVAGVILNIGASGLHLIMFIMEYIAGRSWTSFTMVTPSFSEILICYCVLFCAVFYKKGRWARYGTVIALIMVTADVSYWVYETRFNTDLRVSFIDVGQGNSALIQFPGKERMLIDGGGFRSGTFDTGKNVVAPFLYRNKILHIDYLVLTHPHPDHLNGLRFIASEFSPKEFWANGDPSESPEYKELINIVKSQNIKILNPEDLMPVRTVSGVNLEFYHPSRIYLEESGLMGDNRSVNNRSLVFKTVYKDRSILFTGDIETDAEQFLVNNEQGRLKSDVLQVPHHGSRYSSSTSFLEMVRPLICIISSRKGNRFGFPNAETLERLNRTGSQVLRIDKKGAVKIIIGDKGLSRDFYLKQSGSLLTLPGI